MTITDHILKSKKKKMQASKWRNYLQYLSVSNGVKWCGFKSCWMVWCQMVSSQCHDTGKSTRHQIILASNLCITRSQLSFSLAIKNKIMWNLLLCCQFENVIWDLNVHVKFSRFVTSIQSQMSLLHYALWIDRFCLIHLLCICTCDWCIILHILGYESGNRTWEIHLFVSQFGKNFEFWYPYLVLCSF